MKPDVIPNAMMGLGLCGKDLCAYHATKVGASIFPPESVCGKEHVDKINMLVSHEESNQSLATVLHTVAQYWKTHEADLNGPLYEAWQQWGEKAKEQGKYAAGGWAASPMQLSQYIETVKVLKKTGVAFDDILRVGTASGVHTQEEAFALQQAGISNPKLYIVDICSPPLQESEVIAKTEIGGTIYGSFLDLNGFMDGSWTVITTHFIESFLPTAEQYKNDTLTSEQALELKKAFFKKAHDLLAPDGVFIQAIGTSPDPRRLHSADDIKHTLISAGFLGKNILIVPTTDPFDYENGKHQVGNYFVIAQKGEI